MIAFAGIPSFLRIALQVAMVTMHFHIAKTDIAFSLKGSLGTILHPLESVL